MKPPSTHRRHVCMLCGKPSKESICASCKSKVQGESLHKNPLADKTRKHS